MVVLGAISTSKATGIDFFTTDLQITPTGGQTNPSAQIKIVLRVATATTVKMTLDGTLYYLINGGAAFAADTWYELTIQVTSTDLINFKQDTGTMVVDCRVYL
jgi:hypothetical protein